MKRIMLQCNDSLDPEIYFGARYKRCVYDDPAQVVFDTSMEIAMGFQRAYASYERDILLATRRKSMLTMKDVQVSSYTEEDFT